MDLGDFDKDQYDSETGFGHIQCDRFEQISFDIGYVFCWEYSFPGGPYFACLNVSDTCLRIRIMNFC